ncbi:MAG: hypothetical protein LQ344_004229 [Seirophora lacunosa]|nr:MAG: hypothetical protein LQ344_004229 [Seirophora lacunosa]
MDFAKLMSSEISKKTQPASPSPAAAAEPAPKYLKRADLEAQRLQAYQDEQAALQRSREAKAQQKRKFDEDEAARARARDEKRRRLAEESRRRREEEEVEKDAARRKRLGLPPLPPVTTPPAAESAAAAGSGDTAIDDDKDIPDAELRLKLRAAHEPIALFGETHAQRLRRYYTTSHSALTPTTTSSSNGSGPIPTTLDPVPPSSLLLPLTLPPAKTPARTYLHRQLTMYFNLLLTTWSLALSSRPSAVSSTIQGRAATTAMTSSLAHLRPLFARLESSTLEESILEPVVEIVRAAQERRYVDANDGYLRLSIGKAAWPIGVTMVGIHERSAREKLHESDKGAAHIMSDEVTRKFLQSIKRCLSFAQTRWPPEDQGQLMG